MSKEKAEITLNSEKIKKRERRIRVLKIGLLILVLFLIITYLLLKAIYAQGAFTVALSQEFAKTSGLVIYENLNTKKSKRILEADRLEFMDNISINWLPANINEEAEGAHNGDNYIAYTFYAENQGDKTMDYWYTIFIDDVIKNIDTAMRIMVYRNDEKTIYEKPDANGNVENGTEKFFSDKYVLMKKREKLAVDEIDKFTIVIWIEGDDPDCTDALIGGEMKMHLEITEGDVKE